MSDTEKDNEPSLPPFLTDEGPDAGTLYKYRDFSNMPEEPENAEDSSSQNPRGNLESSIRVQKFPVKLYAILGTKEFNEIVCWMPHGRSWKVLKPNLFESMVMPLFFEYSNYHSFNRLVNAWSFRRISSGPDRGSYYHELFLRSRPHLQKYMRRLPKTHKKLPMKKEDEPDFYKMDKQNPLPPLEEQSMLSPAKMQMQNGGGSSMHGGMQGGGMQGGMSNSYQGGGMSNMQGGMSNSMQGGMSGMHHQGCMSSGMNGMQAMHHHGGMQGGMHSGMQSGFRGQQSLAISPVPSQGMQRSHGGGYPRMFPDGVASEERGYDPREGGGRMGLGHQLRSPAFNNHSPGMRDPANFKPMEFKPATMEMGGAGHHHPGQPQQSSQYHNLQRLRQINMQQMQMFDRPMGPMNGGGGSMNGGGMMNAGPMNGGMNGVPMNGMNGPMGDDPFARMTYRQQC